MGPGAIDPKTGFLTFDAEGQEGGRYHSRVLHVPGPTSGVTIGRGYDMKAKTPGIIAHDLVAVGIAPAIASKLRGAAGLMGAAAQALIQSDDALRTLEISQHAQLLLFNRTYAALCIDTQRICDKVTTVSVYGRADLNKVDPAIRDVLIDLRYRGDYTPHSRQLVQRLVVANDLEGFSKVFCNKDNWRNVPKDRFDRRKLFLLTAVAEARMNRVLGRPWRSGLA